MKVSADHKFPEHACKDREVMCGGSEKEGGYYVVIAGYGCSKTYRSCREAVFAMLQDHACYNICVTE